jgi:MFS family permease
MVATMRLSLKESIPMTDAQFGLLTSIFLWVYGALSPFAGFLADRFKRSHVIMISLLVWSVITWLSGQAQTFEQLLLARALMGVSEACYIPAALALIADYHHGRTRSLATGLHMSGIMVGSGLGGLGGWIADHHDWRFAFTLFGLAGIVYAVLLLFFLRDAPRQATQTEDKPVVLREAATSLLSQKSFWLIACYWGLLGLVGWFVVGWLPTYLQERFSLSQGVSGLSATGYVQAGAVVGVFLGGFLADRWSAKDPRGRIWVTMAGLLIAAPGLLLAANTSILALALGGMTLYGLTRSFADSNTMPILCLVVNPKYRATGYGILNFFGTLVGGATIYLAGALKDAHVPLSGIFQVTAICLVGCAALLWFIKTHSEYENK